MTARRVSFQTAIRLNDKRLTTLEDLLETNNTTDNNVTDSVSVDKFTLRVDELEKVNKQTTTTQTALETRLQKCERQNNELTTTLKQLESKFAKLEWYVNQLGKKKTEDNITLTVNEKTK